MVLGRNEIIAHMLAGEFQVHGDGIPEFGKDENAFLAWFEPWAEQYIQPASIDLPLGKYVASFPTVRTKGQAALQNIQCVPPNLGRPGKDYFNIVDLTTMVNGRNEGMLDAQERCLSHTEWFFTFGPNLAGQVSTRSTAKRWGLDVCGSAGWIDPGYKGRVTLEIQNDNHQIPMMVKAGGVYAQLILFEVSGSDPKCAYQGHYNATPEEWTPECMLPKALFSESQEGLIAVPT